MKLTLRLTYLMLFFCFTALLAVGQKPLKTIKSALKSKKAADALKLVEKYRNDSVLSQDALLFHYGYEASLRLNETENEKIYLKRNADTLALFKTVYNTFDYALIADSINAQQQKNVKSLKKQRKEYAEELYRLFPNLNAASLYFIKKANWQEVSEYSRMAIVAKSSMIFNEIQHNISDSLISLFAQRYLYANYQLKKYELAERYKEIALSDSINLANTLETLALLKQEQHSEEELIYLEKGIRLFPSNPFFLNHITEYHFQRKNYQQVLDITEDLLKKDTCNAAVFEARARVFQLLGKDSLALLSAQNIMRYDSLNQRANYYIGHAYFQLARKTVLPLSITARGYRKAFELRQQYYTKARPFLELYRKNCPECQEIWAPLLYEVYLKLNLGKEFEEIEPLTSPHKK